MNKKQYQKEKERQANLQSDNVEMENWVPSEDSIGTVNTMNIDFDVNYDLNQMNFDFEGDLRKKYPALQDAWEHYQNVKQMCETREKEKDA
tara:strand:+ start:57 stop:329 length:273 start_codon:yes stop_codon:yes gene_type:complete